MKNIFVSIFFPKHLIMNECITCMIKYAKYKT